MIDLPKYNFLGYEEEDKYHLFDEFATHAEEQRKWLIHHLYYELSFVSLNELFGAFLRNYVEESRVDNQNATYYKNLHDSNKESFLIFLLEFLRKGKLIVKVADKVKRFPTHEDRLKFKYTLEDHPMYFSENTAEYRELSMMEAAVADIKKRWSEVPNIPTDKDYIDFSVEEKKLVSDRMMFEEYGVIFTLPENEWQM